MDDIWAGYYVQGRGARVVYGTASVFQARNVHNLIKDMRAEYLGYEHNLELVQTVMSEPDSIYQYMPDSAVEAFRLYRKHFGA